MAARASWKGFLKLSLVSLPVKAYTATASSKGVSLNQLHKECNSRVKYKKVCPEHGELQSADIVSGYEYGKDQYVIIESDEIDKLRTENDKSINIAGFVPSSNLDPIFHSGRTYYLVPDGPVGQKPYSLLLTSMTKKNVFAMSQIVLSGKEQLAILRPHDGMIAMTMLHYHDAIKTSDAYKDEVESSEIADAELELTNTLVDASTIEEFDFAAYKDKYTENLTNLIQMKIDGKEIVQAPNPEEPKIINLMDALKQSVEQATASSTGKRMSASAKTKSKAPAKRKSG